MASVFLKDKNFNFSELNAAMIVAEASEMQSSIAVFSFEYNQFVRIDEIEDDLEMTKFFESELINTVAKQKMVMFSAGKTLLVPSALFDKEKVNDLFQFNFEEFNHDTEKVLFNKLNHLNSYLLFSMENELANRLLNLFSEQEIYHRATSFLETGVLFQNERVKNQDRSAIFVDVLDNSIILSFFHLGKLAFFNQIAFRKPQDLVFFMVKLADEFKLDTKKTDIFLSGRVDFSKDEILQEIRKFFLQVFPFEFTKFFGISPALKAIPVFRHNSLFNLPFCVS